LTIDRIGTGGGVVRGSVADIACRRPCERTIRYGTSVTLRATPDYGSRFMRWSGDCSGRSRTCTFRIVGTTNVAAHFTRFMRGYACTIMAGGKYALGELLTGTPRRDVVCARGRTDISIIALGGDDVLILGRGRDAASGGPGNDIIFGGAGNDSLDGGTGNDRIYGGSGDDRLTGGGGRDLLVGGAGDDRCRRARGDVELACA
jgi:hypothetical protein